MLILEDMNEHPFQDDVLLVLALREHLAWVLLDVIRQCMGRSKLVNWAVVLLCQHKGDDVDVDALEMLLAHRLVQ